MLLKEIHFVYPCDFELKSFIPGVKVEDVTGVGLTARGTTQQQGHLTVGDGLLGQIVEDNDGVHAVIPEKKEN